MVFKKHLASLMVIPLFLLIIISYPTKAAFHNGTDTPASAASKVKNILAYLRAKGWVGEGAGTKLKNFTFSPDIPDRLHNCLSASPDDQGCDAPAGVLQYRMAYASEEGREEPDVLVLASRTATQVYIYRISPRSGGLQRAVLISKIMDGDRLVETKGELLDNQDPAVIRDFQVQLDFWNNKHQKWIASQNNSSKVPIVGVAIPN